MEKTYIVLFEPDRYSADRHARAARHRFATLREARDYADNFCNAYIYRVKDYCGYIWTEEKKTRAELKRSKTR